MTEIMSIAIVLTGFADQEDIIASLKKELTAQRTLAAESKSLHSQIATLQAENQRIAAEQKSLTSTLQASQNEVKALSTKLSAARTGAQADASAKVPGSAIKDRNQRGNTAAATASAKHDDEKQIMKLKEDLYSDLTNLLVHNVKRLEDQDIYDCSQTGRNGSKYRFFRISRTAVLITLFPQLFASISPSLISTPLQPRQVHPFTTMPNSHTPLCSTRRMTVTC
jgi:hypothetical protein